MSFKCSEIVVMYDFYTYMINSLHVKVPDLTKYTDILAEKETGRNLFLGNNWLFK